MVDEFCHAAEFVPTPGEAPLHLVAGKGPFQRTVGRASTGGRSPSTGRGICQAPRCSAVGVTLNL